MISGCSLNEIDSSSIKHIRQDTGLYKKQLHEYDSPYTICYENKDNTYTMYIFGSPIQYKTSEGYAIIDNTIIKSGNKEFSFENKSNDIKTLFPKNLSAKFTIQKGNESICFSPNFNVSDFSEAKLEEMTNMYNEKIQAVVYRNSKAELYFYPTKAGIKMEIALKEQLEDNGYILFKDGNRNSAIIYSPLMKDSRHDSLFPFGYKFISE